MRCKVCDSLADDDLCGLCEFRTPEWLAEQIQELLRAEPDDFIRDELADRRRTQELLLGRAA